MSRMRVEKIANRQFLYITVIMLATVVFSTLPVLTTGNARQDAWASGLLAFAGVALFVNVIVGLGVHFPRCSVVQVSRKLLGNAAGGLVSLIILWSFLHLASLEVRIYAEMIIGGFLTETPLVFVVGAMIMVAVAAAYAGIEVIGRLVDLFFPLLIAMFLVSFFSLLFEAKFINLQPVLARGLGPVLESSYNTIAYSSYLMVLGILIPHLTRPRKATASAFWGAAVAAFILVITAVLTVAVLGPEEGFRSVFPFFRSLRAIRVTEFLERTELLVIFAWGFSLFVALSTFIYCGGRGVAQLFNLKDYRPILLPMGVIWVALSVHSSPDMFEFRGLYLSYVFGAYGLFLVLFPYVFLWGGYLFRKMTGQNPEEERGEEKSAER